MARRQDEPSRGPARPHLQRVVAKALALSPRGFFANDRPLLKRVSGQLQVEWLARNVLPYERRPDPERQERLFCSITLQDTSTAILRLFDMLPELDTIDVRVFQPWDYDTLILAGTVIREDALSSRALASPEARLQSMRVRYRIVNGHLAPLE